jgi:hypothetical protein
MSDRPTIRVTTRQVYAARIVVACDKRLRRITPAWIVRLAETRLP